MIYTDIVNADVMSYIDIHQEPSNQIDRWYEKELKGVPRMEKIPTAIDKYDDEYKHIINNINALFDKIEELPEGPKEYLAKVADERLARMRENLTVKLGKELTIPNPGEFPLYPGKVDAVEWLEDHWKAYLKYFGAEKDILFQDQLGKLDPCLLQALKNQIARKNRIEDSKVKLSHIVPPKKDRITHEIENLSPEEVKSFYRMKSVVRQGFRAGLLPERRPRHTRLSL